MGSAAGQERDESELERADRNWNELLQELRVTQTGVSILFSALLTVPFSQRFTRLDDVGRGVYVVTLLLAACSAVTLVGPVAYHRVLFAQGEKTNVVRSSHRMSIAGLVLLALAVTGVVLLVLLLLLGTRRAVSIAVVFGIATSALWFLPPLIRRRSLR